MCFRNLWSLRLVKTTQIGTSARKRFDATQVLPHSAGHSFHSEDTYCPGDLTSIHSRGSVLKIHIIHVIWLYLVTGPWLQWSQITRTICIFRIELNVIIWTHDHSQSGLGGGGWTGRGGEDILHTVDLFLMLIGILNMLHADYVDGFQFGELNVGRETSPRKTTIRHVFWGRALEILGKET